MAKKKAMDETIPGGFYLDPSGKSAHDAEGMPLTLDGKPVAKGAKPDPATDGGQIDPPGDGGENAPPAE